MYKGSLPEMLVQMFQIVLIATLAYFEFANQADNEFACQFLTFQAFAYLFVQISEIFRQII